MKTIAIDIRGQICPACLLITLREINTHKTVLKDGRARLVIKTDHRDATRTIPSTVCAMGYDINVTGRKGYYEITIGYRK
ncbi:MAG: sulfurtransferase TusA family protein [Nitrospiraceae bacterium]|nr:sulfurtransferase TusA family protein [Nitrospiraceae bacterium]